MEEVPIVNEYANYARATGPVELIFIHIPKTAGISFLQTLADVYGPENVRQIWDFLPYDGDGDSGIPGSHVFQSHARFRETVMEALSKPIPARVLHGHFHAWMLEDLFPGVPRVTWLRNPIDQVLSRIFHYYKMDLYRARDYSPWEIAAWPLLRNCQFSFTGGYLSQFTYGVVESYDSDLRAIAGKFGWGEVRPYHLHRTEHREDMRNSLKSDTPFIRKLKEWNARDTALYDWAVRGNDALGTIAAGGIGC